MRAKRIVLMGSGVLVVWLVVIFVLHLGLERHDHLGYDVEKEFSEHKDAKPGEILASMLAVLVDHELRTGFGWRPNDLFLWGPHLLADNNANRQLGIIMAVRETARVFKDNLTKVSSNQYDKNLVTADTDFRNDAERWLLPSAESRYSDGVAHLRMYVSGLRSNPPTSRELNLRAVELVRLFQAWTDLLGDAHANLYRTRKNDGSPVSSWDVDDYFYHAQGYAHVMYHMMRALKLEYRQTLKQDPVLATLFNEASKPLGKAAVLKPLVVLDGSPDGIFANHRRNLDTYITEARQKMYSIREELQRSPLAATHRVGSRRLATTRLPGKAEASPLG